MNPPGATRKTLSDPQDHSQNPSPQKKPRKKLFGNQTGALPRATGDEETSTASQEVPQPELETSLPSVPGAEGTSSTAHGAAQSELGLPGAQDAETLPAGVFDWENAPIQADRSFKVVNIERLVGWFKPAGVSVKDAVCTNVWRIRVQDRSNSQRPVLEVYGPSINTYTAIKMAPSHDLTAGPIDTRTFQSEAEARELGDCVCRLLDRFPYRLDAKKWHAILKSKTVSKHSWAIERRLVQSRAIDICRPGFDRMQLAAPYRDMDMSISAGQSELRPNHDRIFMRAVRCFFDDTPSGPYNDSSTVTTGHCSSQIGISINVDDLDPDKVNALPDVPTRFPYKMVNLPKEAGIDIHNFSEAEEALVLKAFQILQYRLAFKVGSRPALLELSRTQYRKMLTSAALEKDPDLEEDSANVEPIPNRKSATLAHGAKLLKRIKDTVYHIRADEIDVEGSTRQLCQSVAASYVTDVEAAEFRDAYSDHIRTEPPSVYTAENHKVPQATQASMDAVYPFIILNGRAAIHAPTNLVCTTLSTNYMKSIWAPCIIPAMRAAAEQTVKERESGTREVLWWADWNACVDRIHHLCRLIPYSKQQRLALTSDQVDIGVFSDYMECLRSSSWTDGQASPVKGRRLAPLSTAGSKISDNAIERGSITTTSMSVGGLRGRLKKNAEVAAIKPKPPIWHKWTVEERMQIAKVMKEIEDDTRANPAGLTLPRGADGAPWPFRQDHMPSDDVDLWDWLFREMIARYWRIWWECNFHHKTHESPMTLLLEVIVQWFARKGGVDEFIHCEMTPYEKHPCRFSFGRRAEVEAGLPMATGFTDPSPTSFRTHYDGRSSTIVVQPWFINKMWRDFNASAHPAIFNTLLTLAPMTAYYSSYRRSGSAPRYVMKPRGPSKCVQPKGNDDKGDEDIDKTSRKSPTEDVQPESEDDEDDEDIDNTGTLWLEYRNLNDFVEGYYQNDQKVRNLDHALQSAARAADSVLFNNIRAELYSRVKATCCICGKRIFVGNILRCANVDHEQALFHKNCAPQSIGSGSSALCSACESTMDLDHPCDTCGEKFADEASLSVHILSAHLPFASEPDPDPDVPIPDAFTVTEDLSTSQPPAGSTSATDTDMLIPEAPPVPEDVPTPQLPETSASAADTDVPIPEAPPGPEVAPTSQRPGSTPSTADLLEQRLLKLEQQQAKMEEQQRVMNEQQVKMNDEHARKTNEQQTKTDTRQTKLDKQQASLDEQQTMIVRQQEEQTTKIKEQQTKLDEQQNSTTRQQEEHAAKMKEQQTKTDEKQTKLDQQQTKLNEQQTQLNEQQSSIVRQQDEQTTKMKEQQTKMDEQQTKMDEQQTKMDEQQTKMNEQQAKMDEQQAKVDERQASIDRQKRELASRELDMLAREKTQLQDWQGMITQRLQENEARETELRAILDG